MGRDWGGLGEDSQSLGKEGILDGESRRAWDMPEEWHLREAIKQPRNYLGGGVGGCPGISRRKETAKVTIQRSGSKKPACQGTEAREKSYECPYKKVGSSPDPKGCPSNGGAQ